MMRTISPITVQAAARPKGNLRRTGRTVVDVVVVTAAMPVSPFRQPRSVRPARVSRYWRMVIALSTMSRATDMAEA
ncbi:monooxygenase FAD-binding [Streptomyces azureus]|uniref:Monooxygenase FAD-binding n=1 Tax=Streptomyces azureus TaxID=146537 RepID=A0A0K8PYK0_STRAJ|nr:monooxygenase FAD-binding [Streptomyces azureus]